MTIDLAGVLLLALLTATAAACVLAWDRRAGRAAVPAALALLGAGAA